MVDKEKEEFFERIRVPQDGSPNFDEECLLKREFEQLEKNPPKTEEKKKKEARRYTEGYSYFDGPDGLEQFLLDMEDAGFFKDDSEYEKE